MKSLTFRKGTVGILWIAGLSVSSSALAAAPDVCAMLSPGLAAALRSGAQNRVSIREFGVKGDGVTNDYWTLKAASICLSAAWPSAGLTVYFPSGTYLIDEYIISGPTHFKQTKYPSCASNDNVKPCIDERGRNGIGAILFQGASNFISKERC